MPRSTTPVALAAVVAVAVASVSVATAAPKPPKPPKGGHAVTLTATPSTIIFNGTSTLTGAVSGSPASGVTVKLEADDTRPYGDSYQPTGRTAVTAANGRYSMKVAPGKNTQYRVTAQTSPNVNSAAKLVLVRIRVGLRISDSTPAAGTRVLFSGSVFPAYDGRNALIQRRSPTGRWVTVVSTSLRDAGTTRSSYSRRVRIARTGTYRVKVAGDLERINGFSGTRKITVG